MVLEYVGVDDGVRKALIACPGIYIILPSSQATIQSKDLDEKCFGSHFHLLGSRREGLYIHFVRSQQNADDRRSEGRRGIANLRSPVANKPSTFHSNFITHN